MRISHVSAITALTVACTAHVGVIERPTSPDENPNRFVIDDGALAISRPDESWVFEADTSAPPTVAKISHPDVQAGVDIQAQQILGATLAMLKEPIEHAIAGQGQDFNKLSSRDLEIDGAAAYEFSYTIAFEGKRQRAKMLIVKPGSTLYVVNCRSSAQAWQGFEPQCDAVLASLEHRPEKRIVPAGTPDWGRRIEWETAAGPEAREHASFILDPGRNRGVMLLGSGYQPYLDPLGDAWAYDLGKDSWSKLELEGDPITPGGSRRAAQVPGGAFIHGGYGKEMAESQELWELRFEDTRIRAIRVEQENAPEPRLLHGFAADTKGERFVVFGGGSPNGTLDDTWIGTKSRKGVSWRKLDLDVNPGPRYGFSFAHDKKKGLLIVCSGQIPSSDGAQVDEFALDMWALNFIAEEPEWTLLARYEPQDFPGRRNPVFTFDQRSGDLLVWGGASDTETVIPDLFIVRTREDGAPVQRVSQFGSITTRASGFGLVDPKRSRALMGFGNTRFGPFLDLVEVKLRQ